MQNTSYLLCVFVHLFVFTNLSTYYLIGFGLGIRETEVNKTVSTLLKPRED